MRQLRVLGAQLGFCRARSQHIEDQRHPNPRAADARLAAADRGVNADTVE